MILQAEISRNYFLIAKQGSAVSSAHSRSTDRFYLVEELRAKHKRIARASPAMRFALTVGKRSRQSGPAFASSLQETRSKQSDGCFLRKYIAVEGGPIIFALSRLSLSFEESLMLVLSLGRFDGNPEKRVRLDWRLGSSANYRGHLSYSSLLRFRHVKAARASERANCDCICTIRNRRPRSRPK